MNIKEAAVFAGVTVKTARYYSDIGLAPAARGENGYRVYSPADAAVLRFIARARAAGFSLAECRKLVNHWQNKKRASADVKKLALSHIERIGREMENMRRMRDSLKTIADSCPGDRKPKCPILDMLAD